MLDFIKIKKEIKVITLFAIFLLLFALPSYSQTNPKLVIDGKTINYNPSPVIENGRTLVPVRVISEELGAKVSWNEENRSVLIEQENNSVGLKIDSLIFKVGQDGGFYDTADVPAKIISDRTFVPLRLISNALGVGIEWNSNTRTVTVNSSEKTSYSNYSDLSIMLSPNKQKISGKTEISTTTNKPLPENTSEIRYYLLDPSTRSGEVIARGSNIDGNYAWLPETDEQGEKIIFAALYDANGNFLKGGSKLVTIDLLPTIKITSPKNGEKITESPVTFNTELNFAPVYVQYELTYLNRDKTITTSEADPYGPYNWAFMAEDNGTISLKAIAYDSNNNSYESEGITIETSLEKNLGLAGVRNGGTIENPVTLSARRNFQVSETEYVMRDPISQKETILQKTGYAAYKWFPTPEDSGTKELYVRVKDTRNVSYTSEPVYVTVIGSPKINLEGIGPQQVLTGSANLKINSNVEVRDLTIYLENPENGSKKIIKNNPQAGEELEWTPAEESNGNRIIYADGYYQGKKITSEKINFRIYNGTIYTAKEITEKSNFQNLASNLAMQSAQKTGMSAALQTAQAILETGWGQSVPVDKYTGKFSYNLFGIKGSGPAGSVTSNTWEEYNGTIFRVDANFRAYPNINQSWDDHKNLLLKAQRYSIFRDVMHDSTQGAWALRRAGYATDSKYPLKLINIIDSYHLDELDESSF